MFSNSLRVYCLLWFYNIAQVSSAAPPVHVRTLLVGSLTGDQAIAEAVPALVVRVENLYEAGGEYYTVDAGANWAGAPFELSVRDAPDRRPHYDSRRVRCARQRPWGGCTAADAVRPLHRLRALRGLLVRTRRQQDHCAERAPDTLPISCLPRAH